MVAPHDAWLHGLDPAKEGLGALQDAEQRSVNPAAAAEDLAAIKQLFVDHAGVFSCSVQLRGFNHVLRATLDVPSHWAFNQF